MKPGALILPATKPRPPGWVTIRRNRDGYLMHTPAWAWKRIENKTDVAVLVEECEQLHLFGEAL